MTIRSAGRVALQTQASIPQQTNRIAELDGLRGLAIAAVLLHHGFEAPLLWAGVDLFFVLSGFLITSILIRRKEAGGSYWGYFYWRRAKRILVPYALLLAVSSVLLGTAWTEHWQWFAFFAVNVGAALRKVTEPALLPLWSLAVEEQFYLVWPFVVLFAPRRRLLAISIGLWIAAPVLRAVVTPYLDSHYPIHYLTPFRMDLLAGGAILAWVYRWRPELLSRLSTGSWATLAGSAGALLGLMVLVPGFRTTANTVASNVLIYGLTNLIAISLMLIALGRHGRARAWLRCPALGRLGRISYSVYLIHQIALWAAGQVFDVRLAVFALGMVLTIAYAEASWRWIERPLLEAKPRTG